MNKIIWTALLCSFSLMAHADLQALDNSQLQNVQGQGVATINWDLSINQTADNQFDTTVCSQLQYCRLAINFANRDKLWLVAKGIHGALSLQNVDIAGTDLIYTDDNGAKQIKAALQLAFDSSKPILIRNFGFNSLAVETDSSTTPGYLAMSSGTAFTDGVYTGTGFDAGREVGFLGMSMNGNLAVNGSLKVFSCDASMKRC